MTDAPYRADLSSAILKLQENAMINELYDKWWKQKRGGDECKVWDVYVFALCFWLHLFHSKSEITWIMLNSARS